VEFEFSLQHQSKKEEEEEDDDNEEEDEDEDEDDPALTEVLNFVEIFSKCDPKHFPYLFEKRNLFDCIWKVLTTPIEIDKKKTKKNPIFKKKNFAKPSLLCFTNLQIRNMLGNSF